MADIDIWMKEKSYDFFEEIGIKKDYFILDFGCRHGSYTIPAARFVGDKGFVYALDKNKDVLDELIKNIKNNDIRNILRVDVTDKIDIPLSNNIFDIVFLFDVFHLIDDKKILLDEIKRVLKKNGRLILYPRHHKEQMNLDLSDVICLVEENDFLLDKKMFTTLLHDDDIVMDNVLIFKKKMEKYDR